MTGVSLRANALCAHNLIKTPLGQANGWVVASNEVNVLTQRVEKYCLGEYGIYLRKDYLLGFTFILWEKCSLTPSNSALLMH
jgi:hypothetical protein